jgi:hypothetical protein
MKIPIEELEMLFEKLLFELNINEPDMFEEFNLCLNYAVVPGTKRVAQFSHILKNTNIKLPVSLSIEFGDNVFEYYKLFDVYALGRIDHHEETIQEVKEIILKKRNLLKLIAKI